jgi:hypothetical protein
MLPPPSYAAAQPWYTFPSDPPLTRRPALRQKHRVALLDQELHRRILRLRVHQLPLQTFRPHDRRGEHDGHVQTVHLIVLLPRRNPTQMEDQKLQTRTMMLREFLDRRAHEVDAIGSVRRAGGVEQFVVDGVGDEGGGEFAEVLFQG